MKTIIKINVVLCVLLSLVGCASALHGDPVERADRQAKAYAPRVPKTPFDEALAKSALAKGNVEIKSVLVNCYGRGIGCIEGSLPVPHTKVHLFPYTPYVKESIEMQAKLRADIKKDPRAAKIELHFDPRLSKYSLVATTDEYGRYSFKNLKPGQYYLLSDMVVGHRTVVRHVYDAYGYDIGGPEDSPADMEFSSVLDITQTSGVYKLESRLKIVQINGLR
jgi:hypothetical protein